MATCLQVGEKFSKYSEVEEAIEAYQQSEFIQLYRRNTRSIEVYAKRVPKRNLLETANKELKVAELDLHCIHGGRDNFKSRGTGQRPNTQ